MTLLNEISPSGKLQMIHIIVLYVYNKRSVEVGVFTNLWIIVNHLAGWSGMWKKQCGNWQQERLGKWWMDLSEGAQIVKIFAIQMNGDQSSSSEEEKLSQVDRMIFSVDKVFHCNLHCLINGLVNKVIVVVGANYTWLNNTEIFLPVMPWLTYCLVCNVSVMEMNTESTMWHRFSSGAASYGAAVWLHWEIIMEGTEICSQYKRRTVWVWVFISCL